MCSFISSSQANVFLCMRQIFYIFVTVKYKVRKKRQNNKLKDVDEYK